MAETLLTFEGYSPLTHGLEGIYEIGAVAHRRGVIPEMADAFGHELTEVPTVENLGELIGRVGPAKELQDNIAQVQETLGTSADAVSLAQTWAIRSGLLWSVERSFMGDSYSPILYSGAIITGGVRNWMQRRAELLAQRGRSNQAYLLAGTREMRTSEGPDVEEGMTEADYMQHVVRPMLRERRPDMSVMVIAADSGVGDEVMGFGAEVIGKDIDNREFTLAVISNAGAWVQNAGQMRRALRNQNAEFDADGRQLYVAADAFQLGSGKEPTTTHQNPFTALGQIVRNAQELARHAG